jgi:hypothetical protein
LSRVRGRLLMENFSISAIWKGMTLHVAQTIKLVEAIAAGVIVWIVLSGFREHFGRPAAWTLGVLILVVVALGLYRNFRKL